MTTERLFFQSAVQGLLATLPTLTPEVRAHLKTLGVDPEHLLPAYPQTVYLAVMGYVGETLFPSLPLEEREIATGSAFLRSYGATLLGSAALGLAKVIGPARAIGRLTRSLRTANNFAQGGTVSAGERSIQVWIEPVVRPHLYLGMLREAGRQLALGSSTVALTRFENERAEYLVQWE
jgi:uncharacterized protein (TIGR02265 family)